ncbi:AAA family ATPase [Rhizobium phaseoli]|uniref:AAA family ATPase n=1 Tax=Rhizobium phaseoli TaxID=396 RepID=UPI0007E97AEB|nr:AAA family ATPase [Rhizobium phaseoli]ANL33932.1 ATP-dependent peptidase M41 family protein [Rhizobium phaseoli]ANL97657.1 ATP-dependent peptidase M41 family protein [Rhizobium phaseoli]
MTHRTPLEADRPTGLSRTACLLSLRISLLAHDAVFEGKPFTLALAVPDILIKDYVGAFSELQRMETSLAGVELATVATSARGRRDYIEVRSLLRYSDRVLVLLDKEEQLPSFLTAAADRVTKVAPIDGQLLAEAVSVALDWRLTMEEAENLLKFPIEDVFAALRPGRSAADARSRLEAAKAGAVDGGAVPVESLSGYDEVADWTRAVVADVAEWKAGSLSWKDIDSAVLLSGPPGVGKTLFARALARSCECSFVASSLAQWQAAGHLGDLLKAMRETFRTAVERAPTVLLLDEFDAIGDRTAFSGHNAQYSTEVVAALLECLDGAFRREGVVVVGACNHPERIDKALLRPGRLGRHFRLSLPNSEARTGILKTYLGNVLTKSEIAELAEATIALSGADLEQLVKDARRKARIQSRKIELGDLMSSLPPAEPIEGRLRDHICIHEAGHAAAVIALKIGRLEGVIVMDSFRNGVGLGGGAHFDTEGRVHDTQFFKSALVVQLAGMAAEKALLGDHLEGAGGGAGSDLQKAADIATCMVAQLGMGGITNFFTANSSEDLEKIRRTMRDINTRVERILADALDEAANLVTRNEHFICELAAILNLEGKVTGERATTLFEELEPPHEK